MKGFPLLLALLLAAPLQLLAADNRHHEDVTVLDETTFLMVDRIEDGSKIIQLFKVDGSRVYLVDAIQVDEKKVNFKPLLEYRQLKVEEKD